MTSCRNHIDPKMDNKLKYPPLPPEEEVVITGIAGRFPECDNMRQFEENLMNKKDLITDDDRRWKLDHPEIPNRTGKISDVGKFDALFFGVHFKQAHTMDPMCRMMMEHAYEAVVDAGVNPRQIRGSNIGVFVGCCFSESEKTWFYEKLQVNGFGITGCSRAMLANRISYWLGVHGPSYTVDTACSSSLYAIEHAYKAIREGTCDAAIVGGSNLCLHPYMSLQFSRLGVLSLDGRCKVFDEAANGYARSETVAVVFLQRSKDAKRIYATVSHAKTNCDGYKEQGITFPSSVMQASLLKECYEECGIPPTSLAYMEAHGTGTRVGDPEEVNAIDEVFSPGRKTPLKIGSIKSNLGHTEPASGVCAIAKVVVAMETGVIPPNLNFNQPRKDIKALQDGRIVVVSEPTPWEGGYVGINSFGFGGANVHVLLKSNTKEKINKALPQDDLPRLVVTSGRTEEAVKTILDDMDNRPVDVEYIRLFHEIHSEEIAGHLYRGYTIAGLKTSETPLREIQNYPGTKRPVWFVFSGMGSQWAGMGKMLMRFPVVAEAIRKCDAVLKPRGVDIIDIITNPDKSTFDNILNSFVGIAAIQIGLVDLLRSIGITPDHIIGHSVGELGCAYADGCFTREEMILSAYSRGLASLETETVFGSMAAVGLGYEELKNMCPPDIDIACHNSSESATISGPAPSITAFVAKLQENKIFAREVACSNIPYHSRYIAEAGPKLLAYLRQVIKDPKPRSPKWVSTSVPRDEWTTEKAKYSSAEYHTNNLLNSVLFEETANRIHKNAITIEIAPHGLLQAILRRSMDPGVTNIALTQRGHKDNVEFLLQALGKLYTIGLHPQLQNLYPKVEFPVSRGTPMISPLIRWEHSDDWYVTSYRSQEKIVSGERTIQVTLSDEDFTFMSGHVIDGRNLLPATGYLSFIWETIGMMKGELYTEVPVVFEDVKFLRATTLPKEGILELTVMIQKGTGRFEVVDGNTAVVTGIIRIPSNMAQEKINVEKLEDNHEKEEMLTKDIYKELRLRGYQYSGLFRGVESATNDGSKGHIAWNCNWVSFMDNMLQMMILGMDTRGLYVPTGIQKLVIDPKTHSNDIRNMPEHTKRFPVHVYKEYDAIISGGVEIRGLRANAIARRRLTAEPVLEEYKFVPHRDRAEISLRDMIRISSHIVLENQQMIRVKTVELVDDSQSLSADQLASPLFMEVLGDIPLIQSNPIVVASPDRFTEANLSPLIQVVSELKKLPTDLDAAIAIGHGLLTKKKSESLKQLMCVLREGGFIITREATTDIDLSYAQRYGMDVILEKRCGKEILVLLKRRAFKAPKKTVVVQISNNELSWLEKIKTVLNDNNTDNVGNTRLIVVGDRDFECGALGFVNCLRKEPGGEIVRCVLIQDRTAPEFSLQNPLYRDQLSMDLAINVLRSKNVWGSYRHMALPPLQMKPVYHAWANQLVRGDLSSLRWLEGPIKPNCSNKDLIHVVYAPINFRDIMLTTGKLAVEVVAKTRQLQECVIGFEYCGIDVAGRRVMGMVDNRCLTNVCIADRDLCWYVPDKWSLEEAATVPCVYATCYYALYISGQMKKGDKVLIHAGSGGVGQAAIHLALHEGCEVFTTVGTPEKRQFIRETFPSIDDNHIGNSRDTSFEQLILLQTNGQGVDIVLNSLAEEKLQASVRCLGARGRFLEIGKFDLAANNPLGMEAFLREISFHGIMLDNLFSAPKEQKIQLKRMLEEGLKNGAIKPLTRKIFNKDELEAAFRYMAGGKHIGKVIMKTNDLKKPSNTLVEAYPRYHCLEDKSYVILGGLGGFGLELADWLVLRGAKNVVLTSRGGIKNGYQKMRIELWKSYGANVVIVAGRDASNRQDCEFIIRTAEKLGPVDGVFNLAVVLKDGLCQNQVVKNFEVSFKGKAQATKVLDEVTRKFCPHLRHFVVFSSVSCGRGNAGQTNYGMANSIMERICEKRAADGFPALAVQWGAVADVGIVADMQEDDKEVVIGGTLPQRIASCLQELDGFMQQNKPIVSSMVVAEKRLGDGGAVDMIECVMRIMGVKDLKTVSYQSSLAELGMDSMMAVEIKQTLEREFEIFLTAQDIRGLNFAKLTDMAIKEKEKSKKRNVKNANAEDIEGLKLIVRLLGDQDVATDVCVKLPTKEYPGRSEVFLIPGIEGCGSVFLSASPQLKPPTICLQLGLKTHNLRTIGDMANHLFTHVMARSKGRRDFAIVGYSFGALVAIELVRKLEMEGLQGRLLLIDGSPDNMLAIATQHLSVTHSDQELENSILLGMLDMIAPTLRPELVNELGKCTSWNEKVEKMLKKAPTENLPLSWENQKALCDAIYTRLVAVREYVSSPRAPIRTPITLLKPTMPSSRTPEEDYGLHKVTREKVEVHYIHGNHVTMLDDPQVAAAINGDILDNEEDFKASIMEDGKIVASLSTESQTRS